MSRFSSWRQQANSVDEAFRAARRLSEHFSSTKGWRFRKILMASGATEDEEEEGEEEDAAFESVTTSSGDFKSERLSRAIQARCLRRDSEEEEEEEVEEEEEEEEED